MTPRIAFAALAALLLAAASPAAAHDGPHVDGVAVAAHGATRTADGRLMAGVTLTNTGGEALTLRGVSCLEARAARLLQRHRLFGVESWGRAGPVRLDPGDEIRLAPPDYAIEIDGAPPEATLLTVTLDFGPAGERGVVVFVSR